MARGKENSEAGGCGVVINKGRFLLVGAKSGDFGERGRERLDYFELILIFTN